MTDQDSAFSRLWSLHAPWFGNDPIIKGIVRAVFDEGVLAGIRQAGSAEAVPLEADPQDDDICFCYTCLGVSRGKDLEVV